VVIYGSGFDYVVLGYEDGYIRIHNGITGKILNMINVVFPMYYWNIDIGNVVITGSETN